MNRTILYYPTIDIPRSNWLRHALLYWDEVSSIVPTSWDGDLLVNISPEIHYLIDEGQFRPIKPEDLIFKSDNWEEFEAFKNEFVETVSSPGFKRFVSMRQNKALLLHSNKIGLTSKVHSNKTSEAICDLLFSQGLASRDGYSEWINFEKNTALLYMSLLAKYLADIDGSQTTIGTDFEAYEKFNFKKAKEAGGFPIVNLNLSDVLPVPTDNISFESIIKFKKLRRENLNHFKKMLSDFQVKVSKSSSAAELKDNAISFQETLINGVEDLSAVLRDSRIDFKTKTLKSMISIKSPVLFTAIGEAAISRFGILNISNKMAAIGMATAGVIDLSLSYIENKNKERAKLRESPFSYVYYAQKYGLIGRCS